MAPLFALAACLPQETGVPLDRPLFPTGLALANDHLLVVSSDFDLAKNEGALLAADLATVRAQLPPAGVDLVTDAFGAGVVLPPLGDRPVVTAGGERAYVATRGSNRVVVLDVAADGTITCGTTETVGEGAAAAGAPRCGGNANALQLAADDPFDTVLLGETRDADGVLLRVDAMATLLSSRDVVFFSDDTTRAGAERVQIDRSLDLGEQIGGVRSAVLRPAAFGSDAVVIAAVELARDIDLVGARIVLFQPTADTDLRSFDVTLATGSLGLRDVLLVTGADGDNDALLAALRSPDALARFEIDEAGALPSVRLVGLSSTCREPQALARATVPTAAGAVFRVLLTCHEGDVIEVIDPLTLRTTDAVRFAGRGPYDVVVNDAVDPVEVYVSFFLDGSIGVLRFLVGDDGEPHLTLDGRLGEALPRLEDGRE
jgi:DNA-binding beta-propeller fold protein YncE